MSNSTTDLYIEMLNFSEQSHTYDEWDKKMFSMAFWNSRQIYYVFKALAECDRVPKEYALELFCKVVYVYSEIGTTFTALLRKSINEEPAEAKAKRLNEIKQTLSNYINNDNTITIYRGIYEEPSTIDRLLKPKSIVLKKAMSFTIDKNIAYWFACRKKPKLSKIISARVPLENVLMYSNERKEREVLIIPTIIKQGKLFDLEEETVYFDKDKMDSIDESIHDKDGIRFG